MSDNGSFPPRPRARVRRRTENDEFAAFARRIVASFGRRVSAGDPEALAELVKLAHDVESGIADGILGLLAQDYSWGDLAPHLGVTTRQGARQRWSRVVAERVAQRIIEAGDGDLDDGTATA